MYGMWRLCQRLWKNAITIQLDDEGFYKPVVDEDKCVECNLCKSLAINTMRT